ASRQATQTLRRPAAPRLAPAWREAPSWEAWLQITATPGPRAMRASKARQVTATTCPLVDIQRSFCSRSASGYFVGNLPQKVKLVNGLTLDLPNRAGRVASETPGVRAPVPARIATFSLARSPPFRRSRLQYRATSLGHLSDVPRTDAVLLGRNPVAHQNGPGTRADPGSICRGGAAGCRATMPQTAQNAVARANPAGRLGAGETGAARK